MGDLLLWFAIVLFAIGIILIEILARNVEK